MPELVENLAQLPVGSHGLSLHASAEEAARHAGDFLAGTTEWQAAAYWVPDEESAELRVDRISDRAPEQVGCVAILPHAQVEEVEGRLRPVREVREFVEQHPKGVTAAGETLSRSLHPGNVDEHLEYRGVVREPAKGPLPVPLPL